MSQTKSIFSKVMIRYIIFFCFVWSISEAFNQRLVIIKRELLRERSILVHIICIPISWNIVQKYGIIIGKGEVWKYCTSNRNVMFLHKLVKSYKTSGGLSWWPPIKAASTNTGETRISTRRATWSWVNDVALASFIESRGVMRQQTNQTIVCTRYNVGYILLCNT